ncbi:hypothetical protein TNCV_1483631 [Trichonephila clavipes]|nr:hypothetical protein TNCV_1483631 [Trichonephila clavipes]
MTYDMHGPWETKTGHHTQFEKKAGDEDPYLNSFVQTRWMPNSPSQMIPDRLDWRQIWGSGRPRKGSNSPETPLPCEAQHCLFEKWLLGAIA